MIERRSIFRQKRDENTRTAAYPENASAAITTSSANEADENASTIFRLNGGKARDQGLKIEKPENLVPDQNTSIALANRGVARKKLTLSAARTPICRFGAITG